ncbi:MAG TPA: hypothetical protein DIU37_03560 [Opitutae bacterium]|nr:hypothetical protein [Opitutae bacterium]
MKISQYFAICGVCALMSLIANAQIPHNINHEGYTSETTVNEHGLSPSFGVFECRRTEGCSLVDAAAAKATFAAERYLNASKALTLAAEAYGAAGYSCVQAAYQSAADICKTAHQAFSYLGQFDDEHFSELNISDYHQLREELASNIDPIFLDACKICAEAFIASASIQLDVNAVHTAAAYHDSAAAAAFRAYQFYYAGLDDAKETSGEERTSPWMKYGITAVVAGLVFYLSQFYF